jgi:hypothetical protein
MKNYLIILAILTIVGAINSGSKGNYKYTVKEDHNLYVEVYRSGLTGNVTSGYLTDSTSFKIYLGTFNDESGYIYCRFDGDKVNVEKREHIECQPTNTLKVVERKTYSLRALKRLHNFY